MVFEGIPYFCFPAKVKKFAAQIPLAKDGSLRFLGLALILFRVHHILTDAYGLLVMIEDLVRAIINFPGIGEGMTRITSYNVCYTKLLRTPGRSKSCGRTTRNGAP